MDPIEQLLFSSRARRFGVSNSVGRENWVGVLNSVGREMEQQIIRIDGLDYFMTSIPIHIQKSAIKLNSSLFDTR